MNVLTEQTSADLASIAQRTGFAIDAVESMLRSIVRGGGRMAQFDHPAFGGFGQWMHGGMLMIADPFDDALKQRVALLCALLAEHASRNASAARGAAAQTQGSGNHLGAAASSREPPFAAARTWYPALLGVPNSSGAQNGMRYAWFAGSRRLAVDDHGRITLYDTGDHVIGGICQQQGGRGTVAFASQHGTVDLALLHVVEGAREPEVPRAQATAPVATADPFEALERLAALHARGIVTDAEFAAKRIALLERI